MLRGARSLPNLKVAYSQTIKHEVVGASKPSIPLPYDSHRSMSTVLFNSGRTSVDEIGITMSNKLKGFFTRGVHQTSKQQTVLLDSSFSNSKFASLNLQGLKNECKSRGLKVSGKKIDLVQRLSAFEHQQTSLFSTSSNKQTSKSSQLGSITSNKKRTNTKAKYSKKARKISTTTPTNAKGDSSTIDFYKVPQNPFPEPDGVPPMRIPSLSTKASLKQPVSDIEPAKPDLKVEVGQDSTSFISKGGDIVVEEGSKGKSEENSEEISSRDKKFFASFALLTAGWWYLKPKSDK